MCNVWLGAIELPSILTHDYDIKEHNRQMLNEEDENA